MDRYKHYAELMPVWKRIDPANPPKNRKMLFKNDFGAAVIGVWYEGCQWTWYCGLPKHTPEDKEWIRAQSSSATGRFSDGKPYTETP